MSKQAKIVVAVIRLVIILLGVFFLVNGWLTKDIFKMVFGIYLLLDLEIKIRTEAIGRS
jgi:uncharacterized membrane protein HdeD (DUF308 family)